MSILRLFMFIRCGERRRAVESGGERRRAVESGGELRRAEEIYRLEMTEKNAISRSPRAITRVHLRDDK